ncbi:hypothetical protein GMST_32700 [Geomonas silvestris]|uniref:Uncharacterized protein n=1 Tax=Geomonas silvestris TaxID=2740184 RepID=A0A6V8MLM6_9BACT|nr:hypothetical protein [Geomonas silvestris]GFO60945.1 hypothetical protein GMST_32700 [Geomonas silvestris]
MGPAGGAGRGLNPARIAPDWPGQVNLDLAADLVFPKKGAPRRQGSS